MDNFGFWYAMTIIVLCFVVALVSEKENKNG